MALQGASGVAMHLGAGEQALTLADQTRAKGDEAKASEYEQTATVFATQLVSAENSMEDLKGLHDQALQACTAAAGGGGEGCRRLP